MHSQELDKKERFFYDACGNAQNSNLVYFVSAYVEEKYLLMPLFLLYTPK